jgi:hypothetical protein
MRIRAPAVAFSLIRAASALCQAPPPNLSGIWRANPEKGKYSHKPSDYTAFKIERDGAQLHMAFGGNEENQTLHYRIGAHDNKNEMRGAPTLSNAKPSPLGWQGSGDRLRCHFRRQRSTLVRR